MTNAELAGAAYWAEFWEWIGDKAFILVVIFLAIEYITGRWARPHRQTLDHARELKIAQLTKEAADAKLELARITTSRVKLLTPKAVDSIIEKLKPFAGTKFDIGHAPFGREQWDFLWQLEPIFPKAGWIFVDWIGPQTFKKLNWTMQPHAYGIANVLNVSIEMSPQHWNELLPAARALASALNDIGIAAKVEDTPISSTSANADAIPVLVGEKE